MASPKNPACQMGLTSQSAIPETCRSDETKQERVTWVVIKLQSNYTLINGVHDFVILIGVQAFAPVTCASRASCALWLLFG